MPPALPTGAASDDATLVRAIAEDRPELFAVLVDRHLDRVRTFTAFRTTSRERADRAASAAFIHAFHHLGDWDPSSSFAAWLQKLADQQLGRLAKPRPGAETAFEEMDRKLPSVPQETDMRLRLEQCIAVLPRPIRRQIRLRYGESLSVDQIAQRGNQTPGWVGTVLFRTRQAILDCLERPHP